MAQDETFKLLLHELSGPLVAPVVSVEACVNGPVTTQGQWPAEDLAARLTLVGVDSRFVTWSNQVPGGPATYEAALRNPALVEGLRELVLDAWLSHPTTDRVVVWTGSSLGTEELLAMPPAGVGSTDVVLLSRCAHRSAVRDRLRRLRLLGARPHVVCVNCWKLLPTAQPPGTIQSPKGEAVHVDT